MTARTCDPGQRLPATPAGGATVSAWWQQQRRQQLAEGRFGRRLALSLACWPITHCLSNRPLPWRFCWHCWRVRCAGFALPDGQLWRGAGSRVCAGRVCVGPGQYLAEPRDHFAGQHRQGDHFRLGRGYCGALGRAVAAAVAGRRDEWRGCGLRARTLARYRKGGRCPQVRIGHFISAEAWAYPPLTPVSPGAWDYGRVLWFEGIGGSARLAGPVSVDSAKSRPGGMWAAVNGLRSAIASRIRQSLPEREAGFAIALITGERAGLDRDTQEALQISGLAHILAISGLHMSLVAGGVFWVVRALLALVAVGRAQPAGQEDGGAGRAGGGRVLPAHIRSGYCHAARVHHAGCHVRRRACRALGACPCAIWPSLR
jgi:hypothetical protein